ncbi:MAG: hypothetical protein OEN02_05320 [Gammaproteobacteria bacterium]|nr:hypothetical protein [Gammaproteobacteria bacterium]
MARANLKPVGTAKLENAIFVIPRHDRGTQESMGSRLDPAVEAAG